MISYPALVTTIEPLIEHIKSLCKATQDAGWTCGRGLSKKVSLSQQQQEEVNADTAFFTNDVTNELNRLSQLYSPETQLTPEIMQGLRDLLEKRDALVAGTWLDYLQATRYPMTAFFVGIAQLLESVYQTHWFCLLMPKLTTVSAGLTHYNFNDPRMLLWHFIRSEAADTAIDVVACFQYASAFGQFYYVADQCYLMRLSEPPTVAIIPELLNNADAAYVVTSTTLFYLHKTRNECYEIPLSSEQLKEFNAQLQPSTTIKPLSKPNLQTITALTKHNHIANKPKPLTQDEQTRLIDHSYVTRQCGQAIQELYNYKYKRVSLGGILNAVIHGLRDEQPSCLWEKLSLDTITRDQSNSIPDITIQYFKQWLTRLSQRDKQRLCQQGNVMSWVMEPQENGVDDVETIARKLEAVLQADLTLYDVIPGQQARLNRRNYDFLAQKVQTLSGNVLPALARYDYNVDLLHNARYSCSGILPDSTPSKTQQHTITLDRNSFFASSSSQQSDAAIDEKSELEETAAFFGEDVPVNTSSFLGLD